MLCGGGDKNPSFPLGQRVLVLMLVCPLQTGGSTTVGPHDEGDKLKLWTICWAR